ncbi:MAG: hypothetical protein KJ622_16220 [Alphaproteobacteria bacterium]|nr:hypothetical protein [Alphaproteobacteria bacterium]
MSGPAWVAHYLKQNMRRSKIVLVDAKPSFAKQALMMQAFETYYPGMIDVHLSNDIDNQRVVKVDRATRTVETAAGLKIKADVANIIAPQRAAAIAINSGCAEGDWCPVKPTSGTTKRRRSAWRPNPGRRSTYPSGKPVRPTGTTSLPGVDCRGR